jgi:hypothetical protein
MKTTSLKTRPGPPAHAASAWQELYQFAAAAALLVILLLAAEIAIFALSPLPGTALDYFRLLQSNRLLGLIDAYLLEMLVYLLYIPLFLALYTALRPTAAGYMALALALAGIGIAVFLATNNPFALLVLSEQYAAAPASAEQALYLAAGQALLANTNQRALGGFNLGLFLVAAAGLLASLVMLRGNTFSRATAYVGILANAFTLADYLRLIFAPGATVLILLLAVASGLLLLAWYILLARDLLRMARPAAGG